MYIRITKAGGHEYAQLVESFREGCKVRKRVIANLGRVEEIKRNPGKLESLAGGVNGLMGRAENSVSKFDFNEAPAYGNVFALDELWKDLGIDKAPNAPCDPGAARPTRTRWSRRWSSTGSALPAANSHASIGWRRSRFRACPGERVISSCCGRWTR